MEVEEHIVEEYFRRKGYLTNSNIRLEGNREIDIIALNREEKRYLHIEVSVRLGYSFQLVDDAHKFDIFNYPKKKFEDSRVKEYIRGIFGTDDYEKVIVIWTKPKRDWEEIKEAANKQKITVLFLEDILKELLSDLKHDKKNQRDEIIRTLQLVSRIIGDKENQKQIGRIKGHEMRKIIKGGGR